MKYKFYPLNLDVNINKILTWFNNPELTKFTQHRTIDKEYNDIHEYIIDTNKRKNIKVWAIDDPVYLIGLVSLQNINNINRTAEIAWMIGEPNKGVGFEAGKFVFDYAFKILNLNRIECGFVDCNLIMRKLAEKLNMKHEGISRNAFYIDGFYRDILKYGILKQEYLWREI